MIKLSQRDESLDNIIEHYLGKERIDEAVNEFYDRLRSSKTYAEEEAIDYLVKLKLGMNESEALEKNLDENTLDEFYINMAKIKSENEDNIKNIVEEICTKHTVEAFLSNVPLNETAINIIKNRLNQI